MFYIHNVSLLFNGSDAFFEVLKFNVKRKTTFTCSSEKSIIHIYFQPI